MIDKLTPPQKALLAFMLAHPKRWRVENLQARLGIRPNNVSTILKALEARGLVRNGAPSRWLLQVHDQAMLFSEQGLFWRQ